MKYRVLYVLVLALLAKPVNAQEAITPSQDYKRQFSLILYGYQPLPLALPYSNRSFHHQNLPGLFYKWYRGNGAFRIKAGIDKFVENNKFPSCCDIFDYKINYVGGNLGFGYEHGFSLGKLRLYGGVDAVVEFGKYNGSATGGFAEIEYLDGSGISLRMSPTVGLQYRLSRHIALSVEAQVSAAWVIRKESFWGQGVLPTPARSVNELFFSGSPLQHFTIDVRW